MAQEAMIRGTGNWARALRCLRMEPDRLGAGKAFP